MHWRRQEFSFEGNSPEDPGEGSTPVEFGGEAPVGSLRDSFSEAETVCRHCLQILTAKRSKFDIFAQFTS